MTEQDKNKIIKIERIERRIEKNERNWKDTSKLRVQLGKLLNK
jgi:hypothetical protein